MTTALDLEIKRAKAAEKALSDRITVLEKPAPLPAPGLTFDEHFADLSGWKTQDYMGGGQEATFAPSQATIGPNGLEITAVRTAPGKWLSGCIVSNFRQKYGRWEADIQIPKGIGLWPAFWCLDKPFPPPGTVGVGEIDWMEVLANPIGAHGGLDAGWLNSTLHFPYGGQWSSGERASDLSLAFHRFGGEWRPDFLAFSLDGAEFARYDKSTPGFDPAHIPSVAMPGILDLAAGGGWGGPTDSTTPSPSVMRVRSVQVWA